MRLSFLSIYKKDYYNNNLSKDIILEGMTAPRGRILDVNGKILVDNIGVKSIIYNKLNISTTKELEIAKELAKTLEIGNNVSDYDLRNYYYLNNKDQVNNLLDASFIKKYEERRITSKELQTIKLELITDEMLSTIDKKEAYIFYLMNNGYSYENKIIKEDISNEEYILINELNLEGVRTDITWNRVYPYGNILKEVFGGISTYKQGIPSDYKDDYISKGYNLNDRVGISNLELIYDHFLRGEKAKYKIDTNHLTMISNYKRGKDIVISIDIDLQLEIEKILEEEMVLVKKAPNSKFFNESYVTVSNPRDGSIISLVGKKIKEDNTFTDYSYYNVLNAYNLGSVVKGGTISVGYKYDLINENTKVTDSCIKLYGGINKCSWKSLGTINDINALRMSSNYFQYLIAIKLTGNKYTPGIRLRATKEHFEMYRKVLGSYGLGNITGIDLTKEGTGQKSNTITDDLLLNMSVGHYDTYTPISLAQYINTIATGTRKELSLLKYVLNDDGSIFFTKENKELNKAPIEDKYLNRIREGFKEVNKSGTGYSYTNRKYSSAGKTGTADSYIDTNLDGKVDTQTYTTSYAMFAPYDNPEISISIVSPNIGYKNANNKYRYPLNQRVVKAITDLIDIVE